MGNSEADRVGRLQARINDALKEIPEDQAASDFSPFLPAQGPDPTASLARAAGAGGILGVEAALDEFERLLNTTDKGELQHSLLVFLGSRPEMAQLGLRVPSLEERSPWKVLPSTDSSGQI